MTTVPNATPPVRPLFFLACLLGLVVTGATAEDLRWYVKTSEDCRVVPTPNDMAALERWDRWILMPWRYRWGQAYDNTLVRTMVEAGFNGAVCDALPRADAELHDEHGLLWYLDHAAGRGVLHLSEKWSDRVARSALRRPHCLVDPSVRERLTSRLAASVKACLGHPTRVAYALDDEISWTTFTNPCRWDNHPLSLAGFRAWLLKRYGSQGGILRQWGRENEALIGRMATPDDFQHLYHRPTSQWNLSPWCDALSYMDSQLLNLVGQLVAEANLLDPNTPCGFVGAQGPSAYGGFDYAKLMRKVQFLEVYNIGASMEIARSLRAGPQIVLVASGVGDPKGPDGAWWNWYGLAHGYRGSIVFADKWFTKDDSVLRFGPVVERVAAASRKLIGARWLHDGVAVYYSHPSIQVSWFIDCHAHRRTWINRLSSMNNRLSSSSAAFWAWSKLLEDARIQYNFVSYLDVIENGLDPDEYKVLILPRALALSDTEVEQISSYVRRGGVVIADHMPGLFDHHGRGRAVPALDGLLGLDDHPPVVAGSVFGGRLLSEFDAETHWNATILSAAQEIWPRCKRARGLPVAERQLSSFIAGRHGSGWLQLMNVSLAEYCVHRMRRSEEARHVREVVAAYLHRAGVKPWIELKQDDSPPGITEATYWEKDGRRFVCIVKNPLRLGALDPPVGSGAPGGPKGRTDVNEGQIRLTVRFSEPQHDVIDERSGKRLGHTDQVELSWKTDEIALLSMAVEQSDPARRTTPEQRADGAGSTVPAEKSSSHP